MLLQKLFDHISADDVEAAKEQLSSGSVKVNDCDDHGMTALQHASYKGRHKICQMLLDQGADVDWDGHEHGYTALHFAALSGSELTVRALLAAGARTDRTNSVKRTPAQMAAFVGNHRVVALINNYVPRSLVDYYTAPRGLETEPKLPPALAAPTHHLLMQVNLHPVHILSVLRQSAAMFAGLPRVARVLDLICEREVRLPGGGNEVLAVKAHYLACVLRSLEETRQAELAKQPDGGGDAAQLAARVGELHARAWLRCNANMVEEYQENYVRECIKSFPCRETPLFQQLVANLARAPPAAAETTALGLLSAALNGQRAFQDEKQCWACGEEGAAKRCAACRAVQYCDRACQRAHWFTHKRFCAALRERVAEQERKAREAGEALAVTSEGGEKTAATSQGGEKTAVTSEGGEKTAVPAEGGETSAVPKGAGERPDAAAGAGEESEGAATESKEAGQGSGAAGGAS
ncbi:ankyrin repeat and MYND domain-containing protein 2-like [Pollicipes pollicipes]|uniref:ankyrin repeat and MYND domain-containing protein 2-like n=1 Tax=Pollicipes pollicipes TaxID=41117 RepID=UPI001885A3F5|nr:ankyrin repeat and MYND domain-containing protein 2-like [Pollicipes pollicipes]